MASALDPELTNEQIFERRYDYISCWLRSDWIRVSDSPLHPSEIKGSELLDFLQQHGPAAIYCLENAPSIDITDEGQRVFESGASNRSMKPTASFRDIFRVLATTLCHGLSLSRYPQIPLMPSVDQLNRS